jgi:GT2 family glycosyltransferase
VKPFFSVIIPTAGRPAQLAVCLESLACLDYPRDRYEVIVVDDGNRTPLQRVVGSFSDRMDLTLLTQPRSGPAAARNTGAKRARGTFLAFTDDDCIPNADWLRKLEERLVETREHLVGGRTLNALPRNPYSTASQYLIDYLYRYYNPIPDQATFLTSNNLAVPAAQFRAVGGFDAAFSLPAAEDRDFCDRWRHHGQRMTYAPEVLVYHAHALTFHTFLRQHFRYGRGAFSFHRARARRGQGRVRLESVSFYINLLCYPASQAQSKNVWSSAALLFLSQVANAAGFFWEMKANHNGSRLRWVRNLK